MRHWPVTTILTLLVASILAVPAPARQGNVALTLRSAFRSGGFTPPWRGKLATTDASQTPTPTKPFTQDQVQAMVRDGLGDETGAKAIEQRGIDFSPTEEFIQSLKTAGASEAFLAALRTAKVVAPGLSPARAALKGGATTATVEPASAKKPINQIQVFALLAGQVPSHRVAMLVQERGIDFEPDDEYLREVRLAGGEDELVNALKNAQVVKLLNIDLVIQAQQEEVRKHAARGAEFFRDKRYDDAEAEYRAGLHLDPENSDLHASLGASLVMRGEQDGAIVEFRDVLRLNPNSDPIDEAAHFNLASALANKGDLEAGIGEYHQVLRLNPNNERAHVNLGSALMHKGDSDGAIAEYLEAIRLSPDDDKAHAGYGGALVLRNDLAGASAEYREAIRLNPDNDRAHCGLGFVTGLKGDSDGAIGEIREALRLNPKNDTAHHLLGLALEVKGDPQGALQEYRMACELDPRNPKYRQDYERLLGR